ncbi:MAG: hypothetical protein O2856_15855, partial [Planctomycetota bacterium]|nr:hypothetical protein [Planctomycetota bacterium]
MLFKTLAHLMLMAAITVGIGASSEVTAAEQGFTIYNGQTRPVYVAFLEFHQGGSGVSAGDYTLPSVVPDEFVCRGWFVVQPGTFVTLPNQTHGEIWVRMEIDGQKLTPAKHEGEITYVTNPGGFELKATPGTLFPASATV